MSVSLESFEPAPVSVGNPVTFNASLGEDAGGTVWYRYRVRGPGESQFRTVRDFSPDSQFHWMPRMAEGNYDIEVTARNVDTGETTAALGGYEVLALTGDFPVITPTPNELLFIYSAPACDAGNKISVSFVSAAGVRQSTPVTDCDGRTVNLYLAGLRADTEYKVQQTVKTADGTLLKGPELPLQTGPLSFSPAETSVLQKAARTGKQGVLVQNRLFEFSVATDEDGQVIWYVPQTLQYLTRFEPDGYFFALIEDDNADDSGQLLRELDLAGNTVLETNAGRINEQLSQRGMHKMTSFHHEARRLPDGNILVLAGTERMLTDVQGSGQTDVIGDMILVLNGDLELIWAWDAFDHLDVKRKALLDEKCVPTGGGCPILRLASIANDWLHGNALSMAADGNIVYSARHQDWIIKIDYAGGTGNVIWRLGKGGDFSLASDDPNAWFSHQHDPHFEDGDTANRMMVFDNGNARRATDGEAHSRGQVLELDESSLSARLVLNADMGDYSLALGSAEKLSNGDYFFLLGWNPDTTSQAVVFDSSGGVTSRYQMQTQQYRAFRMHNLYTP